MLTICKDIENGELIELQMPKHIHEVLEFLKKVKSSEEARMEIIIAGVGAGKTTTMADKIIKLRSEMENYLKIFCITFTNNAVECIKQKLQKYYGDIPDSIVICTIHFFCIKNL